MRFARPVLGAAVIVSAIAIAWFVRHVSQPEGNADVAPESPTPSGRSAILAPLPPLPTTVGTPVPSQVVEPGAVASSPTRANTPEAQVSMPPSPRGPAPSIEDGGAGLPPGIGDAEGAFAREPVDAAWAPGAEAEILANIAQGTGLALTGLRVECRSATCRLQLEMPAASAAAQLPKADLRTLRGFEPSSMTVFLNDQHTQQVVSYLRREETALHGSQ